MRVLLVFSGLSISLAVGCGGLPSFNTGGSTSGSTDNSTEIARLQNETTGGSGAPIDSGTSSSFVLFQANWTAGGVNAGLGSISDAGLSNPYSIGAYRDINDGNALKFFVVDRGNNRVLIFNSVPTSSSDLPDVVVGQSAFNAGSSNAGGATSEFGYSSPVHVTVCGNGAMFVSDSGNHRVLGYSRVPTSNGAAADFVIGQPSFSGNTSNNGVAGGAAQAERLSAPYAVHCLNNKLFINDRNNRRILVYSTIPTTGLPSGAAVAADFAIGQPDLTTVAAGACDFSTSNSYLNTTYEVGTYDDKLYIADGGNYRILVYNTIPSAANAKPNFVVGQASSGACAMNGGGANNTTQASLYLPNGLAFKDNKMAVSDHSNGRILFFDLPITSNGPNASARLGRGSYVETPGASGGTNWEATNEGTFKGTKGLVFDDGYIWVGDGGNNRIQVLALPY